MGRLNTFKKYEQIRVQLERTNTIQPQNFDTLRENLLLAFGPHVRRNPAADWRRNKAREVIRTIREQNPKGLLPFMLTVGYRHVGNKEFDIKPYLRTTTTDNYPAPLAHEVRECLERLAGFYLHQSEFLSWILASSTLSIQIFPQVYR